MLAKVFLEEGHKCEELAPEAKRGALTSAKNIIGGDRLEDAVGATSLNVESNNPTPCLHVLSVLLGVYLCHIWSFQSIGSSLCTQTKD